MSEPGDFTRALATRFSPNIMVVSHRWSNWGPAGDALVTWVISSQVCVQCTVPACVFEDGIAAAVAETIRLLVARAERNHDDNRPDSQ